MPEPAKLELLPNPEAANIAASEEEGFGPNGGGLLQFRGTRGVYAWDPFGEETEDEYLLFRRYRDLSPPRDLKTISRLYRAPLEDLMPLSEKFKWEYRAEAYGEYMKATLSKYQNDVRFARRTNMIQDAEAVIEQQMGKLMTAIAREKAEKEPKTYILRVQQLAGIVKQLESVRAGRPVGPAPGAGKLVQVNFNTLAPARGQITDALEAASEVVEALGAPVEEPE